MSTGLSRAPTTHSPPTRPATPRSRSAWQIIAASVAGATLLALYFFCPRFWLWPVAGLPLDEFIAIQPEFHRAFHALHQLQDPWQRIDDATNRVIEWRLLWPTVAHALGFSKGLYFALPHLGCLATLAAVATIVWRITRDALPTATATLLVATSSWFFVSTGWLAYFDSWLILALLLASFGHSRWILFGSALLAPWIDERFLLALPLCLAVRSLGAHRDSPPQTTELWRDGAALLAGLLPYIAVRFTAEFSGLRATSTEYLKDRPILPAPWFAMGWGVWNGLRLGWIVIALASIAAVRARSHRFAVLAIVVTLGANICIADDLSRSASIATPALVAALLLASRYRSAQARRAFPLLCLGNLVLPAQHVIAAPGTTAVYHCVPILGAAAELDHARTPPDFANPATYTRRSLDHFQNRATERAFAAIEIALRLDPHHAKAIAHRGILLYVTGKQSAGAAELDRALQVTPELYDARMQRAAFRQQAGDLNGALEDVRRALHDMPADWPRRNDAQQFERSLSAQVAR